MSRRMRIVARPAFRNRWLNPYNARIYQGMTPHGVEVREFRGPPSVLRLPRPDILHIHWPESSFNHGLFSGLATTEALLAAMRIHRARGGKVMWTLHNLEAHERRFPRTEERFWRRYLPMVDGVIALGSSSLARARQRRPALVTRPAWV
ncbi:MAG: glycosyltransferase, partial [Myxococcota bacterium]